MTQSGSQRRGPFSRRDFLRASSLSAGALLTGCAIDPVTGRGKLSLMSQSQEIGVDRQHSPQQFSADYGAVQDGGLNRYVAGVGRKLGALSHRPEMPYSFRVVNATYINAYAFPGGSIAATRGIMLNLENEAELAGLLGHELGHVNAQHTAEQMTKGILTNAVLSGVTRVAASRGQAWGQVTSALGQVGAGALLARYSRSNEHEADALGLEYMVKGGYNPDGFVGLMDLLNSLNKHKSSAIEMMFATHPMSSERYSRAVSNAKGQYAGHGDLPLGRQRYMDETASLRRIKGAIEAMQNGEKAMGQKKYGDAEGQFQTALRQAPHDYTANVLMAKCLVTQEKYDGALGYAEKAKGVYPQEAQGHLLAGFVKVKKQQFGSAYQDFVTYDRVLPGNAAVTFFKGRSLEGMGKRQGAAQDYQKYLQVVNKGDMAKHAYQRLVEWGYVKR
ncbi:MAG: M48 family metalloprotease [Lentisphaerae bacterium]|jgi:beta-barrel assembly-enhancing protease|nr:M48 family metalloprotease [Lentisphaerota bacterium]MBT4821207.1 M48 family metalloprotease [Lentisphaerota bacterium]MBT5605897.1 M48 family metalloprotease [Lentisphaerota bacterium]MBT7057976.1 M48 family metalloprotease [Lentisphaerota bacterium]MBT7848531.1 M48 family metalloprotease [Lentisphaerota bacterium]